MYTISKSLLLFLIFSGVALAQSTPTPTPALARRFGDCVALNGSTANLVGTTTNRQELKVWAETGPVFCSHTTGTPTPNQTPGSGWNKMNTGFGIDICQYADQPTWCFGASAVVCYDEARITNQ